MSLFWFPLAAASAHVFEEFVWPGGFGPWYRAYRPDIATSMSARFLFWINAALLFACFSVGVDAGTAVGPPFFLAVCALLVENGVFHAVATIRGQRYSPGVVTGVLLYVPLALYGYWTLLRNGRVSPVVAVLAAAVGLSYHALSLLNHRRRARRLAA
jgi:hypothetical protein